MLNSTIENYNFMSLPFDNLAQTPVYQTPSDMNTFSYDNFSDYTFQECGMGKGFQPHSSTTNYDLTCTNTLSNSHWFDSVDSVCYPEFSSSLGSDSFADSPQSSNPTSPSSSGNSDSGSPMCDFTSHNPPSPFILPTCSITGQQRIIGYPTVPELYMNNKKRPLDDIYHPVIGYSPSENMCQGGVINELFANAGTCIEPYEFSGDSVNDMYIPYTIVDQSNSMGPMMNILNCSLPPPQPSPPHSQLPSTIIRNNNNTNSNITSNVSNINNINNYNNYTTKNTTYNRNNSSVSSTKTPTLKTTKKGRRLSGSKSKNLNNIKKEVGSTTNSTTNSSTSSTPSSNASAATGSSHSVGSNYNYSFLGLTSKLQQLEAIIATIDPTMRGGLSESMNYLSEIANIDPLSSTLSTDKSTAVLKISMGNSVMGMLFVPTILSANSNAPNNTVADSSLCTNNMSFPSSSSSSSSNRQNSPISNSVASNNNRTAFQCQQQQQQQQPLTEEQPPIHKRKKARSSGKAATKNFHFNVINQVPQKQTQPLPLQQTGSLVTVL